jgi:hypothetical protein
LLDLLPDEPLILSGQGYQFVILNWKMRILPVCKTQRGFRLLRAFPHQERVHGCADAMKKLDEKISGTAVVQQLHSRQ